MSNWIMANLDPTDIEGQERELATAKKAELAASRQDAEDFKWVMSDKRGRRFVYDLLEKTGLHRNPFTGTSETFFLCGKMEVGQRVQAMIDAHCPERYQLMIKEHQTNDV